MGPWELGLWHRHTASALVALTILEETLTSKADLVASTYNHGSFLCPLFPLSHAMSPILFMAFLQFWPCCWPSPVYPPPTFPLIQLPIGVTILCLSTLHCESISRFSFMNAICASTQNCLSVGSPKWSEVPVFQHLLSLVSIQSVFGDQLPFLECVLRWLVGTFSFGYLPAALLRPAVLFLHFYPQTIGAPGVVTLSLEARALSY